MIATAADPAALVARADRAAGRRVRPVLRRRPAARVTTHSGMKVDLKVVEPDQFGNVLQHFTGSKDHNVALREAAVRRGLHVSEYGILDDADGRDAALRDRGGGLREARAARGSRPSCARAAASSRPPPRARCPELVTLEDLRGDLHSHTTLSDGHQDVEAMVEGARARGYEYLAITDHSAIARLRQPRRRRTRCARRSSACARSTPSSTTSTC